MTGEKETFLLYHKYNDFFSLKEKRSQWSVKGPKLRRSKKIEERNQGNCFVGDSNMFLMKD